MANIYCTYISYFSYFKKDMSKELESVPPDGAQRDPEPNPAGFSSFFNKIFKFGIRDSRIRSG
jgi:hypothetical protein